MMKKRSRSSMKDGVRLKRNPTFTHNYCCPDCKKFYKGFYLKTCPQCHGDLHEIGYRFRPPGKSDTKGWKTVQLIIDRKIDYKEKEAKREIIKSVKPSPTDKIVVNKTIVRHSIGCGCDIFYKVVAKSNKSITVRKLEYEIKNRDIKLQQMSIVPSNVFSKPKEQLRLMVNEDGKIGPTKRMMWWNIHTEKAVFSIRNQKNE